MLLKIGEEQLKSAWKETLGLDYEIDGAFNPLHIHPQDDFENWYFFFKLRFEIQSDLGSNLIPQEKDIQDWIKQATTPQTEYGEVWRPSLETQLYFWYTKSLEFASMVKKMYERNVSKEVFYYYINQDLNDSIEEYNQEWEKEELKHLQALLLTWVRQNLIDELSDHCVWILKLTDEYADVDFGIKKEQNTQEETDKHIKTFEWKGNKPLDEDLKHFQPLGHMFVDSSLEGLKMAFGGGNIYDIKGCIKPTNRNTTAVRYFIYHLIENGYIYEVDSMEEVMNVLMDSSGSYRRAKSKFLREEYTLDEDKETLILNCINSLPQ
jgi:hypothetical protein